MENLIKAVSCEDIQSLVKAAVTQPMGILYLAGKQTAIADSITQRIDWSKSKSLVNRNFVSALNDGSQSNSTVFKLPRFSIDELIIFANGVVVISVGKACYFASNDEEARSIFIKMFQTVERISEEV